MGSVSMRAGTAMLLVMAMTGCVTNPNGPSLARFNNSADACNAQRTPLIETENQLGNSMMAGALIGGLAGAGIGAAASKGDGGAILAGALIGGLVGGTLGYQEGLSQRHENREDMLAEINRDASADAQQFSTARGVIGNLNACRNRQIDAIQADRTAERITHTQARAKLDQVKVAVEQDNQLIQQVLGHVDRRTDTYLDAARRTTDQDDGQLLGAARTYTPGQIIWNDAKSLEVVAASANLRAGPGTSHRTVGGLKKGDRVNEIGRSGDWIRIAHSTEPAFIHAPLVRASGTAPSAKQSAAARPEIKNDVQRVVVESRDTKAAGEQSAAQLASRLDDMYTVLGTN